MPSPFPGMDPYLEDPAVWPPLHDSLIVYSRDALQPLLLPGYYVEIRERVYFEQSRDVIYPDATVRKIRPAPVSAGGAAVVTADEPTILRAETRQRESFLEIRAVGSREVVTVIEFISPTNNYGAGQGREEYRDKQEQVLGSRASLVEIDLLCRGSSVVAAPAGELLTLPQGVLRLSGQLLPLKRGTPARSPHVRCRPAQTAAPGLTSRGRQPRPGATAW